MCFAGSPAVVQCVGCPSGRHERRICTRNHRGTRELWPCRAGVCVCVGAVCVRVVCDIFPFLLSPTLAVQLFLTAFQCCGAHMCDWPSLQCSSSLPFFRSHAYLRPLCRFSPLSTVARTHFCRRGRTTATAMTARVTRTWTTSRVIIPPQMTWTSSSRQRCGPK